MLTRVWQEREYHIDVCRVTSGAHIEHLQLSKKIFFGFLVVMNSFIKVGPLVFPVIYVCNHGENYETPCITLYNDVLHLRV